MRFRKLMWEDLEMPDGTPLEEHLLAQVQALADELMSSPDPRKAGCTLKVSLQGNAAGVTLGAAYSVTRPAQKSNARAMFNNAGTALVQEDTQMTIFDVTKLDEEDDENA